MFAHAQLEAVGALVVDIDGYVIGVRAFDGVFDIKGCYAEELIVEEAADAEEAHVDVERVEDLAEEELGSDDVDLAGQQVDVLVFDDCGDAELGSGFFDVELEDGFRGLDVFGVAHDEIGHGVDDDEHEHEPVPVVAQNHAQLG
jgi:hypothetical protein